MARVVERWWREFIGQGMTRAQRRPCRYEAYIPDRLAELALVLPAEVAADVSDAEQAILHLNIESPHLTSLEALARLLLRAESVASSRIEGLQVGPRRLVRAEAAREIGVSMEDATAEAVLGNVEAMTLAVTEVAAHDQISLDDVLAIHRALMRHTDRPELGGQLRTTQNWIGGNDYNPCNAAFVPPPPEEVPRLLDDLVLFINDDRYSPLVQAALAHGQFETIHPFADGNGRTGRALIHVILRRRGLAPRYVPPISLILATRSRDYIGGLRAMSYAGPADSDAARNGIAAWVSVFSAAAGRAAADAAHFGAQVDALVQSWRDQAQPIRANSTADHLLRLLPSAPIVTVSTAARLVGRSTQATNAAIEQLTAAGVLKQTTIGRRNRAFEAVGLLDALTVFERGLASPEGNTRISPPIRPVPYRPARQSST